MVGVKKMKILFEDGDLIRQMLGVGWLPYSAQLNFELRKSVFENNVVVY